MHEDRIWRLLMAKPLGHTNIIISYLHAAVHDIRVYNACILLAARADDVSQGAMCCPNFTLDYTAFTMAWLDSFEL
jgi:hypothetical protein